MVTGASSGVGLATALGLAGAGAEVVLAVRDEARGRAAAERIRAEHPDACLRVELVELASLASIAAFTTRIGGFPVDLLVNNAGLNVPDPTMRTADGFDLIVGVNFLAAWALTAGLWPALRSADAARVVNLGSLVAANGRITPGLGRPAASNRHSYADSKLAQVVFAGELSRRSAEVGSAVTAVAAHPGWSQTAIVDPAPPAIAERFGDLIGALQSPADGAQPVLLAATLERPANYYGPTLRWGAAGPPGPARLPSPALVPGVGARLWQLATSLTGIALEP